MAEQTIIVCDVCGQPATETVTVRTSRGNFAKDLCATHLTELTNGARKPRPGRPRVARAEGTAPPRKKRTSRKKTAARKKTTRRRRRKPAES